MARSPVSNLGDLLRKEPSLTAVGCPRPISPKLIDKNFTYTGGKSEDWNTVSNAITALFQRKKLAKSELSSKMGKFIAEVNGANKPKTGNKKKR